MAIMPQTPAATPSVSRKQLASHTGDDDRRCEDRIERDMPAHLMEWGGSDPIDCVIRNLASGGEFLTAPGHADLCVGQRYEIFVEAGCPRVIADAFADGCYATVIRTQSISDDDAAGFGAGVRFDQPLML